MGLLRILRCLAQPLIALKNFPVDSKRIADAGGKAMDRYLGGFTLDLVCDRQVSCYSCDVRSLTVAITPANQLLQPTKDIYIQLLHHISQSFQGMSFLPWLKFTHPQGRQYCLIEHTQRSQADLVKILTQPFMYGYLLSFCFFSYTLQIKTEPVTICTQYLLPPVVIVPTLELHLPST